MKNVSTRALLRSRYPVAAIAGLLLACAFPNPGIAGFAWIAPAAILAVTLGTSGRQSFRIGYVAGLAHYLASLYWLLCIPVRGFPILGWIALSAFLALFTGTWTWLASRFISPLPANGISARIESSETTETGFRSGLRALAVKHWIERFTSAIACAALWVGLEMIIARIFGGFPWNLLGASQYKIIPLIQIASLIGVYGVSFLLVWTSVSLLNAACVIIDSPQSRYAWMREMLAPIFVVTLCLAFGFHRVRDESIPAGTLRVTMVQPSIPQTMIWDRDDDMVRFQRLLQLSEQALTNQTDLMIWPEAAIPRLLRYEREILEPVTGLARSNRIWMIVGSDDAEPRRDTPDPEDAEYYNASFLISPDGQLVNRYRKRSLVMFGEYIPLERWLPFIKWFTPVTGSFTPGDKAVPFVMNYAGSESNPAEEPGRTARTSVLICFEDNFPHLVREYVEPDTDFLVNITNNGWFGESAAQWQHAANSIFRAIETGVPLIRCSNNGLTCWVDARGRLREVLRDADNRVYGAGFLTIEIPMKTENDFRRTTPYQRAGDWFGWSCTALTALRITGALLRNRSKSRGPSVS